MIEKKLKIGAMELDGRIIMPPLGTYKCTDDGRVTDEILTHYAARAENPHVNMIITEHSYIALQGKAKANQLSVSSDDDLDGLRRLVTVIHRGGSKAVCQLNHAGSATLSAVSGQRAVAPSPVILPTKPRMGDDTEPAELSQSQIQEIVRWFAEAAVRAVKAGYDAVEIHSAHAYLLNQFYSPLTNKRKDEYGGSLENRLRIHREVISAVRKAVGPAYPVAIRLGGCDYTEGGSAIEDAVYAAKVFENDGVDLIDLSGGMCRYTVPGRKEPGYFRDMSEAVKKEVSLPVVLTGGVKTLEDAEKLLTDGVADLIGVGRALFKKADWETANQK